MSALRRADDDDRGLDERAGTGDAIKVTCRFRRHPYHPNDRICDLCSATVHRSETTMHERSHYHESLWEDKLEQVEAELADLRTENAEIRGEWGMLVDLLHPRIQRMMNGQDDASG